MVIGKRMDAALIFKLFLKLREWLSFWTRKKALTQLSQPSFLHYKNILFQRDWQVILSDINLEIKAGQWLILRGCNGCGKTTLLKLGAGLLTPTAGHISLPESCSYLGHTNGIKATQTLNGLVKSFGEPLSEPSLTLINALALDLYRDIPFYQLSTGLKRRVALVQLLMPEVNLYIVDEPLDNLDPFSCQLLWQIMAQKIAAGAAILMAHHGGNPFPHPAIKEFFLDA